MNKFELIVFDFDGVMTDNRVFVDENGKETVAVSRADGQGIKILKENGYKMVIISSEKNKVVAARAKKIDIPVYQDVGNKGEILKKYCDNIKINLTNVLYIGNDINDIPAMNIAGTSWVPQDAEIEVTSTADKVLETKGGYGVVREIARLLCSTV